MAFLRFLAARLFKAILVIVAIAALNFVLIRLAPGDPASVMAGKLARQTRNLSRNCGPASALTNPSGISSSSICAAS